MPDYRIAEQLAKVFASLFWLVVSIAFFVVVIVFNLPDGMFFAGLSIGWYLRDLFMEIRIYNERKKNG